MIRRVLGLILLTLLTAGAFFAFQTYQFGTAPLTLPEEGLTYRVNPGSGVVALADDLEGRGVLSSALHFRAMVLARHKRGSIKAGEYRIPQGTTPLGLLELLTAGQELNYALTLVEGWDFDQVMEAVQAHQAIKVTLEPPHEATEVMAKIGVEKGHPEGRFLADTYHFPRGTSDVAFLQRAYREMESLLQQEWGARDPDLPLKSPYEALILASIVEKETGLAVERPEIAGVFVRRLRKGMRLQTDPTVIYGMGDRFDGNLRRADLKRDTPYNTYLHAGLPPTPICMPGKAAIHAVLHPNDGTALYFVATGQGGHYFSATLAEHNRAVRKYQKRR